MRRIFEGECHGKAIRLQSLTARETLQCMSSELHTTLLAATLSLIDEDNRTMYPPSKQGIDELLTGYCEDDGAYVNNLIWMIGTYVFGEGAKKNYLQEIASSPSASPEPTGEPEISTVS